MTNMGTSLYDYCINNPELKHLLDYIEITLTKQQVEMGDDIDRDIFLLLNSFNSLCSLI